MQDPLSEVLATPGSLGDAEGRTATEPEISEAGHGTEQGRAVCTMRDGTIDDALDSNRLVWRLGMGQ